MIIHVYVYVFQKIYILFSVLSIYIVNEVFLHCNLASIFDLPFITFTIVPPLLGLQLFIHFQSSLSRWPLAVIYSSICIEVPFIHSLSFPIRSFDFILFDLSIPSVTFLFIRLKPCYPPPWRVWLIQGVSWDQASYPVYKSSISFNFIQLCAISLNFIHLHTASLNFIQLHVTSFSIIQLH